MNQEPKEPKQRRLPTWKRIGFEYLVMILVYVVALSISQGNMIIAVIAVVIAMIGLRVTRPSRTDRDR